MSTIPNTNRPRTTTTTSRGAAKPNKTEQIDAALRDALSMHDYSEERWRKLIEAGASDEEISHHLVDEFKSGGGSQTESGIQFAYRGLPEPLFWLHASTHYTTMKPTLQGKGLINRVREVLSIPLPKPTSPSPDAAVLPEDLLAQGWVLVDYSNGDWRAKNKSWNLETPRDSGLSFIVANARQQSEKYVAENSTPDAHEFKATTALNGKCAVCRKPRDTEAHRAFAVAQKARELAGQPKQTETGWLTSSNAKLARVIELRRNPHAGKRLTDARRRDWQSKLTTATEQRRWGLTMQHLAEAVVAVKLPPVLNGLTNEYQVRQLMDCVLEGKESRPFGTPQAMGPTIKTAEEFAAAVKAISPYVPVVEAYTVDGELEGYGTERAAEPAMLIEPATDGAVDETKPGIDETVIVAAPPVVAEVFYALDLYNDKSHEITYLDNDRTVALDDEDSTAIIGVNSAGAKRVVSAHNLNLTHADILARYGDDSRLVAPHVYRARDGEDGPCCFLPDDNAVHALVVNETQPEGQGEQAEAVTAAEKTTPVAEAAPVGEPFTAEVEVELNDHDIAQKARAAATLATEIAELETEKKETAATYTKKIGGKEEERDKLLSEIGRGFAAVELKLREHRDYERKVVEKIRIDTGAVVESRPMRPREYQQPLPSL